MTIFASTGPVISTRRHCNAGGIGATWFGYTTLWINRFGLPLDDLGARPTRTGTQLTDVLAFFASERPSP